MLAHRPARAVIHRFIATMAPLALAILPAAPAALPDTPDESPGQGSLIVQPGGGQPVAMPLKHTHVRAEISAFVASVDVTQTFTNPFDEPIEATYLFPLPERAAVDDFVLEVGERRIRGQIQQRERAEAIYQAARAAGHTAAVLHQERPNIFSQSVANIAPGREIKVKLRYVDLLVYRDGGYDFLFPMVVGHRYNPPGPTAQAAAGGERASASIMPPGTRTAHDISMEINLEAGVPIRSLRSASHQVRVADLSRSGRRIELAPMDRIPNKDLMLRWDVAGEAPEVGLLAHRGGHGSEDGYFALLVQPKAEITRIEAAPKEILFVLDESGSMNGTPIEMSKRFMREALRALGPADRFNVVRFAGAASVLSPAPLANTEANVRRGLAAVEAMRGEGGTQLLEGFKAALSQPTDPSCIRIAVFLTDGYIGNEHQILEAVKGARGEARIFTLGIGSSVNHYLLREMAELGRGSYTYIRPNGKESEAVDRFFRWVTRPYLTDLEVDWGTLRVEDVQPSRLNDLYSGQTLTLVGRYLWGGEETVILKGRLGGRPWEKQIRVALPETQKSHAALASVWARHRIRDMLLEEPGSVPAGVRAEVTSLALAFRLMSPFTSFVAVDESEVVNPDGRPVRVEQPLPMPEFVSFEGCFEPEGPSRVEIHTAPELQAVTQAEYLEGLPIIGHNYQDILTVPGGVTGAAPGTFGQNLNPDIIENLKSLGYVTSGASAEYGRADGGFANVAKSSAKVAERRAIPGSVPPSPMLHGSRPGEDADRVERMALRVLADLADDGRLSQAEGLPALAGLLSAQGADGAFSSSSRAHALATAAVKAAAKAEPRLKWVREATALAEGYLRGLTAPQGPAAALAAAGGSEQALREVLAAMRGAASEDAARLIDRIAASRR